MPSNFIIYKFADFLVFFFIRCCWSRATSFLCFSVSRRVALLFIHFTRRRGADEIFAYATDLLLLFGRINFIFVCSFCRPIRICLCAKRKTTYLLWWLNCSIQFENISMTLKADASSIEWLTAYLQMRRLIDGVDAENSKYLKFDECWSGETVSQLRVSIFFFDRNRRNWERHSKRQMALPQCIHVQMNLHSFGMHSMCTGSVEFNKILESRMEFKYSILKWYENGRRRESYLEFCIDWEKLNLWFFCSFQQSGLSGINGGHGDANDLWPVCSSRTFAVVIMVE